MVRDWTGQSVVILGLANGLAGLKGKDVKLSCKIKL